MNASAFSKDRSGCRGSERGRETRAPSASRWRALPPSPSDLVLASALQMCVLWDFLGGLGLDSVLLTRGAQVQ